MGKWDLYQSGFIIKRPRHCQHKKKTFKKKKTYRIQSTESENVYKSVIACDWVLNNHTVLRPL